MLFKAHGPSHFTRSRPPKEKTRNMAPAPSTPTGIQIELATFPPAATPPGSANTLFLGGAGARGLEIEGKFIKFTAIGVYLEDEAVKCLAGKWKGKTAEELTESVEFFRDVVTGPFEKFIRITMILPLTGLQYSEKVSENCVAIWKSFGIYTDAEEKAIEKFKEVFKDQNFPPGSSVLFTQSPTGSLTISFSKDQSIPEKENAVIENKLLSEAVLESIIGKHGVSPEAKRCLAARISELLKESTTTTTTTTTTDVTVGNGDLGSEIVCKEKKPLEAVEEKCNKEVEVVTEKL